VIIPTNSKSCFEELFGEIETNREKLGIASFGASVTTLEEVFIKVGEEQDTLESRSHTALFQQLSGQPVQNQGFFFFRNLTLFRVFSLLYSKKSLNFNFS